MQGKVSAALSVSISNLLGLSSLICSNAPRISQIGKCESDCSCVTIRGQELETFHAIEAYFMGVCLYMCSMVGDASSLLLFLTKEV